MAHVSLRTTKDNTELRVKQPPPQPPALGSPSEGFSVRSVQTTGRCVQPAEPRAQGSFLLGDAVGPEAAAGAAPGQGPAGGGGVRASGGECPGPPQPHPASRHVLFCSTAGFRREPFQVGAFLLQTQRSIRDNCPREETVFRRPEDLSPPPKARQEKGFFWVLFPTTNVSFSCSSLKFLLRKQNETESARTCSHTHG